MFSKIKINKTLMILIFLALFSFSVGVFDNYQELWLSDNGFSTQSISRILTYSSIVTALSLLFLSIKVSPHKLKNAMIIVVILKMVACTSLICLNGTSFTFLIKILMFFNAAFSKFILSSIYPLLLTIKKDDVLFTKRGTIDYLADTIGLFVASILLGKTIGNFVIDYNKLLLISVVFMFLSFIVLSSINVSDITTENTDIKKAIKYFNKNKSIYLFLIVVALGAATWHSLCGLKMLSFTQTLGLSPQNASYVIIGLGVITSLLAMIIVKHFKSKNDHINAFVKYGSRLFFYLAIFITNSNIALLIGIIYLLVMDSPYGFMFSGYFIGAVDKKYTLLVTVLKYCASLVGKAIGVFVCGITFTMEVRYIGLATLILGVITYVFVSLLVKEKKKGLLPE